MASERSSQLIDFVNSVTSAPSLYYLAGTLVILGAAFGALEWWFPANRQPLFRYQGVRIDLLYWFITPVLTRALSTYIIAGILFALYYLQGKVLDTSLLQGFGPLSRQPLWLQGLEILIIADFVDYWTHRIFHNSKLWRFHAIHHSPKQMNWISSSRMHPVNDLVTRLCQVIPIAMLGFSVRPVLVVVPYLFFYVIFIHSNLSWSFGPLKYLLVSPAYHRWHHASEAEAIDKNFASIFPIWDLLFGTYYFPDRLPTKYGVVKEQIPETILGQMAFPFRALFKPR